MAERRQQRLTAWRRARAMPLVTVEAIILGEIRLELEEAAVLWVSHQPPKAIHARSSCYQLWNVWAATLSKTCKTAKTSTQEFSRVLQVIHQLGCAVLLEPDPRRL